MKHEQIKDDRASTLRFLEALTSKVDEAPALLLLTPTQLDALRQPWLTAIKAYPPISRRDRL